MAALVLVAIVAASAGIATGRSPNILGDVKGGAPKPSCPEPKKSPFPSSKLCRVINTVTGFQTTANGRKGIFKVPSAGHLVAWSVDLSRPNSDERDVYEGLFDAAPSARIGVLKKASKSKFTLAKQSPEVPLDNYYGQKPIFTLNKPLKVKKGQTIALTTPNWVPNFAHDGKLGSQTDKWRASRSKRKCGDDPNKSDNENRDDIIASKPHDDKGSKRTYGCTYTEGRLLYWAYFVPNKKNK